MKSLEQLTDSVFYIMAALAKPRHGYAVMGLVEETSKGAFVIGPASLYTIIKKLLKEDLIVLHDNTDSRRKVYVLTEKGRTVLREDIVRRKAMIELAEKGLERGIE
ncbi:MAG TPA: PadR family transcriptional regulator [Bacillus bacterium]|uniref:PadR family transcriptional regulator n=1 Tax=Siminovitchia fordii TaxID=254759 RepID=A0ABQ4K8R4_9BACI|nr:PadR family transcriptional regulator [Siminovitchia fordii]GIN22114.1 PadR family transcriptional regulator [Siminovitchia fordii]HBZ09387.1 PadR family transcriptional regulator [Bacillus sp. (in: firmicutes)]